MQKQFVQLLLKEDGTAAPPQTPEGSADDKSL